MDGAEQIRRFQEFLESYETQVFNNASKGAMFVAINFAELAVFDPVLAEELLNEPEETIKAAEAAIQEMDLPENTKNFRVRFKNLPESQKIKIRDIRSSHLNKLVVIEGLVRQKSDVRPQVVSSRFECPGCGNIIAVLQIDSRFKEPVKCGCGRKGKFTLLSKELVDAQGIVMEEIPENLEGGEQPKRMNIFLKEDLVSPITEKKTNPGSKICVVGQVKDVPVVLRSGSQSTKFDLIVEANYVEAIEENFYDIEISKKEEEEIKALAADPKGYEKLIAALAPSIYGHERIKEALVLQLISGVQKRRSDGIVTRGDMHVLLVGDPGCIAADSMVSLYYKGMKPIKQLGKKHLQGMREVISKIRKNSSEKGYDFATLFHIYKKQPVLKVKTETGKSIMCTYNQPFLTKDGWKRADGLVLTEKIRVMPSIPNNIKKLKPTDFVQAKKSMGHLKCNVKIPRFFTKELSALCGYILGDGNIHPSGYRVTCYVNSQETDLIQELGRLFTQTFNVNPKIITLSEQREKSIKSGAGMLRQIIATQSLHLLEINSKQVATNLSFLKEKAVPQAIFESPKPVVAEFISWLFEADGSVFGNGRGRTSIQLKPKNHKLLQGVQLLLLYFGIQSRIIEDNLCIRRKHDMELFAKHIGFKSIKKTEKIVRAMDSLKNRTMHLRKGLQRYEKVVEVLPAGIIDVFDFEVPKSHMFVANGILCHNSGKSQLLKRVSSVAPKGRYVSGKGVSGAGLTAAVVRDEFLGGWSLEAGAMVLANNGLCAIDEMDKISPEDRGALHEGLEQQSISISKANIQATLLARTTVLAAANPKFGRFDPYGIIAEQINMPPTLINRFDLIFPIKDIPDESTDEKMAKHILNLHQTPDIQETEVSTDLLRKFIAYARKNCVPKLTDGALNEIKSFYVQMRNRAAAEEKTARAIPVSPRQLEALVRIAEASAKTRLSDKVTKEDARRSIELLMYCLLQVGLDRETGRIDIDRIATGVSASQRDKIFHIKEILAELESKLGKTIPMENVVSAATEGGLTESEVEEIIERLKRMGDIYEPRHGFIQKL